MAQKTQYEVLVKQNGHWEIISQYQASEEGEAIKEAKSLEVQKHFEDVKVIREIFDQEEVTSKEYNVYQPGKKKYRPPHKFPKKSPKNTEIQHKKTFSDIKKEGRSLHYTLMNIIVVCSFSIFIIAMFIWFTSMHIVEMIVAILE
jgi:hypothetical protein